MKFSVTKKREKFMTSMALKELKMRADQPLPVEKICFQCFLEVEEEEVPVLAKVRVSIIL